MIGDLLYIIFRVSLRFSLEIMYMEEQNDFSEIHENLLRVRVYVSILSHLQCRLVLSLLNEISRIV
jgi:hypothetical protein